MKQKALLETITKFGDTARCPIASWRDPLEEVKDNVLEFLHANIADPYIREKDINICPDTGNLCVSWEIAIPASDLLIAAKMLAGQIGGDVAEPEDACCVKIAMRHDIPMFFRGEDSRDYADGQPMRPEFVDGLRDFVARFDAINQAARDAFFQPVREAFATKARHACWPPCAA
jgi:hypothetical protein